MLHTFAPALPSPALRNVAVAGYARVSLEARVAGASPHELVMLLYRRLVGHLRDARDAAASGDTMRRLKSAERAMVIVDGLDATLDTARGGSVAASLHEVYALLGAYVLSTDPADLGTALSSAEAIADAWAQIRPR